MRSTEEEGILDRDDRVSLGRLVLTLQAPKVEKQEKKKQPKGRASECCGYPYPPSGEAERWPMVCGSIRLGIGREKRRLWIMWERIFRRTLDLHQSRRMTIPTPSTPVAHHGTHLALARRA